MAIDIKKYTGFYPSPTFWCLEPERVADYHTKPFDGQSYMNFCAEEAVSYKSDIYELKICRDSMCMLRINEIEEKIAARTDAVDVFGTIDLWRDYLDYAIAVLLLIDSNVMKHIKLSYFYQQSLNFQDAFRITYHGDQFRGQSIPHASYATLYCEQRQRTNSSIPVPLAFYGGFRLPFPDTIFSDVNRDFSKIVNNTNMVSRLSKIGKSIAEYKAGNFELALLIAWFLIELNTNELWSSHLKSINEVYADSSKKINKERLDLLTDG